MLKNKLIAKALILGASLFTLSNCVVAGETYPAKPIRLIVPYTPAGGADSFARLIAPELEKALGQTIVVENMPGAATAIGTNTLARSKPDGYTLMFTTDSTFVVNPLLYKELSYNVKRDLQTVGTLNEVGLSLVVSSKLPVNSLKELVDYTKERPSTLSYGSYGIGSQAHIMGEAFKKLTGTDLVHVPYKGSSPAVVDVLGGQVLFTFPSLITVKGYVDAGKLKVLAISGKKRSPQLPNVPTFTEAGFEDMNVTAWYGFFAPKNTPSNVVDTINKALSKILNTPEFQQKLADKGATALETTPTEMDAMIDSESKRMARILKLTDIRID